MSADSKTGLDLRRFAIDNIIVLSRIFGMSVFAVVISVILARYLGTAGKGSYDLVNLLNTLVAATVFNLGIPLGTIYFSANHQYDLKTIVSTNVAILGILIPVTLLAGFLLVRFEGERLFGGVPESILYLGLILMPFFVTDQVLSRIFNGLQDYRSLGLVDITQPLTTAILLLGLVITNQLNLVTAIFSLIVGYILTDALTLWLLRSKLDSWRDMLPRLNVHYAKELIVYGLKIYANIIVSTLLLRIDMLLVSSIGGGASSVGIYAVAVTLGERVWTLGGFTSTVLLPRIASWHDEEEKRDQLTLLSGKYTLWISFIGLVGLVVFGRWIISTLFPAQFATSYDALMALLPGIMMYNFARIFSSDLVGRGKGGVVVPVVLAATIVNVALNLIVIPRYDFIGASLASSVAYSLYGLVLMWLFFRQSKLHLMDMLLPNADDLRRMQSLFNLMRSYTQKVLSGSAR
jgi:O-antigen/teichoic acid export membrane protein